MSFPTPTGSVDFASVGERPVPPATVHRVSPIGGAPPAFADRFYPTGPHALRVEVSLLDLVSPLGAGSPTRAPWNSPRGGRPLSPAHTITAGDETCSSPAGVGGGWGGAAPEPAGGGAAAPGGAVAGPFSPPRTPPNARHSTFGRLRAHNESM